MRNKTRHPYITLINILIVFIILIVHYTSVIDISIKNATPLIIIPFLISFSIFNQPTISAVTGLIIGVCMDSVASNSFCFNSLAMMLTGIFVSVLFNNMFNRNLKSAVLISVLASLLYYIMRWIFFYAVTTSAKGNLSYLMSFAFPSVLYTNVFIFPFYFLYKYFNKIKSD